MLGLQELLVRGLRDYLDPPKIFVDLISKRLRTVGIELTHKQKRGIEHQFKTLSKGIIHFDFDEGQVHGAGFHDIGKFQDTLENLIGSLDADVEALVNQFEMEFPDILIGIMNKSAKLIQKSLLGRSEQMLLGRRQENAEFTAILTSTWGEALNLLETHIVIALEAGEAINKQERPQAGKRQDYKFEVLSRLHARSCQVAQEILNLLRNGFADGAHARWRSLHEIAVIALFIAKHDKSLSERYLLHDGVESFKAANQYQTHSDKLGLKRVTKTEMGRLSVRYRKLLERFGQDYRHEYGWASTALENANPKFTDIESNVELDHLRPYYKLASHNIHANPKGVFAKLGLLPGDDSVLLAGPSSIGLADPGHATALSMSQISTALLLHFPSLDSLVLVTILQSLQDKVGESFLSAHKAAARTGRRRKNEGKRPVNAKK